MSGSEQSFTSSDARLSVTWLREQLSAHGPEAAPSDPDVDTSLAGLANPPIDGLNAAFAMVDAFRAGEALDELRVAREALLDAYAGLARAFDDEADQATVFDDDWRDASRTARRVAADIRSFSAAFRDATDETCAMAAGMHSLEGARLYPDELDDELEAVYWLVVRHGDKELDVLSAWAFRDPALLAAAREAEVQGRASARYEVWVSSAGGEQTELVRAFLG